MFVSTFELLQNVSQLPREFPGMPPTGLPANIQQISRDVIQGYFLTVSNLENREVNLQFVFTTVSSPDEDEFNNSTVGSFFDSTGVNEVINFKSSAPKKHSIILPLPPHDTGLLLVQPNPMLLLEPLEASEIEIRGYVEVKNLQSCDEGFGVTRVLLTPEHRGTFYQLNVDDPANPSLPANQQLDQIAYSLPTGTGGALFELS